MPPVFPSILWEDNEDLVHIDTNPPPSKFPVQDPRRLHPLPPSPTLAPNSSAGQQRTAQAPFGSTGDADPATRTTTDANTNSSSQLKPNGDVLEWMTDNPYRAFRTAVAKGRVQAASWIVDDDLMASMLAKAEQGHQFRSVLDRHNLNLITRLASSEDTCSPMVCHILSLAASNDPINAMVIAESATRCELPTTLIPHADITRHMTTNCTTRWHDHHLHHHSLRLHHH
jgi:hypothetical protein